MRVTIAGPNLPRPLCDRGTMHVHAAGCADLRRYPQGADQGGWTIEATSRRGVVEDIYGDVMHDYDPPAPWTDYEGDIYWAPCTAELPQEPEAEPISCTGDRYPINPDAPEEGTDIHHEEPCPVHPAPEPRAYVWTVEGDIHAGTLAEYARSVEVAHYYGYELGALGVLAVNGPNVVVNEVELERTSYQDDDYLHVTLTHGHEDASYRIDLRA